MNAAVHFVGFKGGEYVSALHVWGRPDFIHRHRDPRLIHGGEVAEGDTVIYANGEEARDRPFSFNDSAAKGIGK